MDVFTGERPKVVLQERRIVFMCESGHLHPSFKGALTCNFKTKTGREQ